MALDKGNDSLMMNGYSIYQFSKPQLGTYFVSVPSDYDGTYELFVGFPLNDFSNLSREEVIEQINDFSKMIHELNAGAIYAIPDISTEELEEAAKENDDRKYKQLFFKIQSMTSDIYQRLTTTSNTKASIKNVVSIVKRTESDTKFIQWLEINLPNFVNGITYDKIRQHYYERIEQKNNNAMNGSLDIIDDDTQKMFVKEDNQPTSTITPIDHTYDYDQTIDKKKVKVKRLVKQNINTQSPAFSKISFILLIITLSFVFGIAIAYLIMK